MTQPERIVLFQPTHEQSLPTFHVNRDLADGFKAHLTASGFELAQPTEALGVRGPGGEDLIEILIKADTSVAELEAARQSFLEPLNT